MVSISPLITVPSLLKLKALVQFLTATFPWSLTQIHSPEKLYIPVQGYHKNIQQQSPHCHLQTRLQRFVVNNFPN